MCASRFLVSAVVWLAFAAIGRAQIVANTWTPNNQSDSSVCADADGNFVVVWTSDFRCSTCEPTRDGDQSGVYGQRFASSGARVGTEFQIHTQTSGVQEEPRVACAPDGKFMVVWTSREPRANVYGRSFGSDGVPLTDELPVPSEVPAAAWHDNLSIDADGSGSFIVAWHRSLGVAYSGRLFLRSFASNGAPLGPHLQVDEHHGHANSIACRDDGVCLFVWVDKGGWELRQTVMAQLRSSASAPLGDAFQVSLEDQNLPSYPLATVDRHGGFIVSWTDRGPGYQGVVSVRRYDDSGASIGSQFEVGVEVDPRWGSPDWWASHGSVTMDPSGDLIALWSGIGDASRLFGQFGQRFSDAGVALSEPFLLNTISHNQSGQRISRPVSNRLLVTYGSDEPNAGVPPDVHPMYRGLEVMVGFCHLDDSVACPPMPRDDCVESTKAKLRLKRTPDGAGNKVAWDWLAADDVPFDSFGLPDIEACGASYAMCVYEPAAADSSLVASSIATRGGECDGRACWKRNSTGFKYGNRSGFMKRLLLRSGQSGKARIKARAQRTALTMPSGGPVTAQIVSSGGACWTSTFDQGQIRRNDERSFIAKKD